MNTVVDFVNTSASYVGPFFILLGLLIFVHELGHFLVAKYYGVKVEVFSLGFGKKILQFKRGDTNYCISIIPLGGYVKMYGDDPTADIPESEKSKSFLHKPVGQRIAIVLAGPLMNLFFAALLFSMIAFLGENSPPPVLGDIKSDTKAYSLGFRSGMTVVSINDEITQTWEDVSQKIKNRPREELTFVVRSTAEGSSQVIKARTDIGENDNLLSTQRQVGSIEGLTSVSTGPTVGISDPQSPAALAGLTSVEVIKKINSKEIVYFRDLENTLKDPEFISALKENLILEIESIAVTGNDALEDPTSSKPRKVTLTLDKSFFDLTYLDSTSDLFDKLGFEKSDLYLYQIKADSPAKAAGFESGDKLITINEQKIHEWDIIVNSVKNYDNSGKPLKISVLRNGETKNFEVVPKMTELMKSSGAEDNRFTIGIIPAVFSAFPEPVFIRHLNPLVALQKGAEQSWIWSKMVAMSFVRMIQNEVSSKNIGGVITIGKYAGQSYQVGLTPFLKLMAIISINLFLINLLPVPILDGGHLLFFTIEAIRGAPLSMRKMEIAQQVGLIILMSLMVFALFNDISNLINPPW